MVPRLAIISDGNENHGSIARASWLAQQLQVPVDTSPCGAPAAELAHGIGQPIPRSRSPARSSRSISVVIAPPRKQGTVELTAEGKVLGTQSGIAGTGQEPTSCSRKPECGRRGGHLRRVEDLRMRETSDSSRPSHCAGRASCTFPRIRAGTEANLLADACCGAVRCAAHLRSDCRQPERLSTRRLQQLGSGKHSGRAQGGVWRNLSSRAEDCWSSAARRTYTRRTRRWKTRWIGHCPRNWRRRGRRKALASY